MLKWFRRFRIRQLEKAVHIAGERRALAIIIGDDDLFNEIEDSLRYYRDRINRLKNLVYPPTLENTLTRDECFASLCVWEWMLENHKEALGLDAVWDEYGTNEMRERAITIGVEAEIAWQKLTEEEQEDQSPFDWEFIPRFLQEYRSW